MTQQQIDNLQNNYAKFNGKRVAVADLNGISIEYHDRGMGRAAYYAVKDGEPVAYCVGYVAKRPNHERFMISSTFVHPDWRRKGIGQGIYLAIINQGITLVSDWDLSPGGEALWASLMRNEPRRDIIHFKDGYVAKRRQAA